MSDSELTDLTNATSDVKSTVRRAYARIAVSGAECCDDLCCGGMSPEEASRAIGYDAEQLAAVPEGANLGLGCGNPLAIASVQRGETVLDLGSGGGFDCFLAASAVGPEGSVIGVDMTPEMLALARRNAEAGGFANVEFRLGELEALPVADASVDLVISNCVISLVPDRALVYREAYRVLRRGGRLVISDTLQTHELPPELLATEAAKAACLSAAVTREEYEATLVGAGFASVDISESVPLEVGLEQPLAEGLNIEQGIPMDVIEAASRSTVSITVSAAKPG